MSKAEALRDAEFPTLGIGLAFGHLIGQHNWLGRLKPNFVANAEVVEHALAGVQGAQTYRETRKDVGGIDVPA